MVEPDDVLEDLDIEDSEFPIEVLTADASDRTIEKFFEHGRLRVVRDRNDFFLHHAVDLIESQSLKIVRCFFKTLIKALSWKVLNDLEVNTHSIQID